MSTNCLVEDFIINNPNGLHARPGAFFVDTIKPFKSEVKISNTHRGPKQVNARSLLNLMVLGIKKGHSVRVYIEGEDAQEALDAVRHAIASGLGE